MLVVLSMVNASRFPMESLKGLAMKGYSIINNNKKNLEILSRLFFINNFEYFNLFSKLE